MRRSRTWPPSGTAGWTCELLGPMAAYDFVGTTDPGG